jgi:hypothetical protein
MEFKRRLIDIGKILAFTFCNMFKNVKKIAFSFEIWKSAKLPKNVVHNIDAVSKTAPVFKVLCPKIYSEHFFEPITTNLKSA